MLETMRHIGLMEVIGFYKWAFFGDESRMKEDELIPIIRLRETLDFLWIAACPLRCAPGHSQ